MKQLFLFLSVLGMIAAPITVNAAASSPSPSGVQGAATLFIMGEDGVTKNMELKATKETAGPKEVEGFKLGVENVVSVALGGSVTVFGDIGVDFTGAKLTPSIAKAETVDIPITAGEISFAGIAQGVYTLNVIVSDTFAYECIIVIGPVDQVIINKEITEVNQNTQTDVKIIFEKGKSKHDNKPKEKPSVCYFKPNDDPSCKPVNGKCPDGFAMNEQGNCHPGGKCPSGFERVNDDETGTCYSKKNTFHCPISNAIVLNKNDCAIYEPEPTPTPTPTPSPTAEPTATATPTPAPQALVEETPTPSAEPTETEEPLDSICGGVPCTASEKEDSTTSDPIPGTSVPEPDPEPQPDPEPEPESEPEEDKDSEAEEEEN